MELNTDLEPTNFIPLEGPSKGMLFLFENHLYVRESRKNTPDLHVRCNRYEAKKGGCTATAYFVGGVLVHKERGHNHTPPTKKEINALKYFQEFRKQVSEIDLFSIGDTFKYDIQLRNNTYKNDLTPRGIIFVVQKFYLNEFGN